MSRSRARLFLRRRALHFCFYVAWSVVAVQDKRCEDADADVPALPARAHRLLAVLIAWLWCYYACLEALSGRSQVVGHLVVIIVFEKGFLECFMIW